MLTGCRFSFDLARIVFVHANLEGLQELDVFAGNLNARPFSDLVAVDHITISTFVKTDRDLENEEQIVAGGLDPAEHFADAFGFRKRLVDRIAQFFQQALELAV
jgi:hypothetical protein